MLFKSVILCFFESSLSKKGIKTVLWGCSIEPDIIKNEQVSRDLKSYEMVVARESITYNAVKEVCSKVFLAPDPAFFYASSKM